MDKRAEQDSSAVDDPEELREWAAVLLRSYQYGSDDARAVVAQELARLPTPLAIALVAAMAEQLDEFERLEFTNLLFEVATGKYRSVFDRAGD